jgi:predicted TIM-barrel fold metal-dependent hydrolase
MTALPPGATDCHTHVFGPQARYPFDPARTYTPGEASTEQLLAHQQDLGLARVVIVQPSPYGTDNACTLQAVRQIGPQARAVAVIDPALPSAALHALHEHGVRGIRLNLETSGRSDPDTAKPLLQQAAGHIAALGWHVQVYTSLKVIAALHDTIAALPVPLVIDHFGRAMAAAGPTQPGFEALLNLVRSGKAYVKLSAAHRIAPLPDDAAPMAKTLIAANPARMLWGSDWPHCGTPAGIPRDPARLEPFNDIDDHAALARLRHWSQDEATFQAILVDNPAHLYGFAS